jgi:hypothetical protein
VLHVCSVDDPGVATIASPPMTATRTAGAELATLGDGHVGVGSSNSSMSWGMGVGPIEGLPGTGVSSDVAAAMADGTVATDEPCDDGEDPGPDGAGDGAMEMQPTITAPNAAHRIQVAFRTGRGLMQRRRFDAGIVAGSRRRPQPIPIWLIPIIRW